jgi:hypothetical protein
VPLRGIETFGHKTAICIEKHRRLAILDSAGTDIKYMARRLSLASLVSHCPDNKTEMEKRLEGHAFVQAAETPYQDSLAFIPSM